MAFTQPFMILQEMRYGYGGGQQLRHLSPAAVYVTPARACVL